MRFLGGVVSSCLPLNGWHSGAPSRYVGTWGIVVRSTRSAHGSSLFLLFSVKRSFKVEYFDFVDSKFCVSVVARSCTLFFSSFQYFFHHNGLFLIFFHSLHLFHKLFFYNHCNIVLSERNGNFSKRNIELDFFASRYCSSPFSASRCRLDGKIIRTFGKFFSLICRCAQFFSNFFPLGIGCFVRSTLKKKCSRKFVSFFLVMYEKKNSTVVV